jgi:hypothetical protein
MAGLGSSGGHIVGEWFLTTNSAPTRPTTWYVALFDTNGTELTGGGYARQAVTFASGGGDNVYANTNKLTFGAATGADWSQAVKFQILSALTNGTAYSNKENLTTPKTAQVGDTIAFNIGDLTVTF